MRAGRGIKVRQVSKMVKSGPRRDFRFCGCKLVIIQKGREGKRQGTYGTISSWRPERKRIGSSVIEGMKVSDGQT